MRAANRSRQWWLAITTLVFIFLVGAVTVSAQAATPIGVGENQTGQIEDSQTPVRFALSVASPLSVQVQVLAISPGLAPTFRVVDPGGVVILNAVNPGTQTIVQATPNLVSAGTYTIEVSSANGAVGQFLISVQAGAPLSPPQPLTPGQPLNGSVNPQNSRLAFSFAGSQAEALLLLVRSSAPNSGPVVALRDADTGDTLALNGARLAGAVYRIATGAANYLVEVTHSGITPSESFVICLTTESASASCPGIGGGQNAQPTAIPTAIIVPTVFPSATLIPTVAAPATFAPVVINPTGPCMVASARGATINVRSGPGTNFSVVGQLPPTVAIPVVGRLPDNTWFQVNLNGIIGWVSASVVIIGGNCTGVSVVQPPTVLPPNTTQEVTTGTPTTTTTATTTSTPTATSTNPPAPAATLNYSLSPVYGSTALTSGFIPDPYYVGITAGGTANASYLGGSCYGYTTSAPSFSVNYTSGAFPTLRFYFIGSGDTTMIINSPSASYLCVDDSFGTVDPTIDFNSPSSGRYDVWIATYAEGASISGTLYVTENTGNHP